MNYYKTHLIFSLFFLLLLPNAAYSATFVPNIVTDEVDSVPGDGNCSGASGNCSLRAAIQESNALGGEHTILLSSGEYFLGPTPPGSTPFCGWETPPALLGRAEGAAVSGDLDIIANITIEGEGADNTIVNGCKIDRVFDIRNTSATMKDLSITGGRVLILNAGGFFQEGGLGGALHVINSTVNVDNVWLYDNSAVGMGGAIFSVSSNLDVQHSLFYKNKSLSGGGIASVNSDVLVNESFFFHHGNGDEGSAGGGIYNFGELTITKSIFFGNLVALDGGAIFHGLGLLSISNSTLANNTAFRNGGGLYYRMGEVGLFSGTDDPVLRNVSIIGNVARAVDNSNPDQTTLPDADFIVDFSAFEALGDPNNSIDIDIDFSIPGTLGESDGGVGGGGIMVAGQTGQNQRKISLRIVNSIISGNVGPVGAADECITTSESDIISLGGNVTNDSRCNFSNSLDLPPSTYLELQLVPFNDTENIFRSSFPGLGTPTPHNFMNQGYYNQLTPHVQVFPSSSILRGAAVESYCPPDDQRSQTRVDCDVGAYEFFPPTVSPMQFVVTPGGSVVSVFAVPGLPVGSVTYELMTGVTQGVLSQPNGFSSPNWIYLANVNATGSDSFVYRTCYPSIGECSNEATVNINMLTDSDAAETVTIEVVEVAGARRDGIFGSYSYPGDVDRIDIINEADLTPGLEDTEYSFPFGAMFFSIENIAPSDTNGLVRASVMLQLPMDSEIPEGVQIRKLNNLGEWQTLPQSGSGSTGIFDPINKTIALTLVDNDIFDLNPTVGIIRDPVALGVPTTQSANKPAGLQFSGAGGAVNIFYCCLLFVFIGVRRLLKR